MQEKILVGHKLRRSERMDCTQRAHPPVGHDVRFDGNSRRVGLYNLET
ncbi:MAG: short-chain fatty acyl-CoA regulator family protein [Alphaproteobacteria bacterium]|nr:short-chain fatty acyl-CoA regulator family protein [Alphaproteobacteria bacterium]